MKWFLKTSKVIYFFIFYVRLGLNLTLLFYHFRIVLERIKIIMDTVNRKQIFESLPVPQAVLRLAVPTIISQIIALVYNLADTFYVGLTGDENMVAAISLCVPATMLMNAVCNLIGIGGSSVISRALGVKNTERAKTASAFCLYTALLLALLISVLSFFIKDGIAIILGASANTLSYVKEYLFWVLVAGAVPTIMATTMGIIIRSDGNAVHSSIGLAIGGILNIILDPIFIFTLEMGVAGAALATMLSNGVSALYFIMYLIVRRKKTVVTFNPMWLKNALKIGGAVLLIGAPAALNTSLVSVSTTFFNNVASGYGETVLAAIGVIKKIDLIPWSIMFGLTQGVLPLIGYNYAAKNYGRMKSVIRFTIISAVVINAVCLIAFEIFAPSIVKIFIDNDEVVAIGGKFLRLYCTCVPFMSLGYIINTTFQALGKSGRSLLLAICRHGIFFIPFLFSLRALFGIYGVVMTQTVADGCFAALGGTLFILFLKKLKEETSHPHIPEKI